MKKISLIIVMILTFGFVNVFALDAITVPTCGVSIKTNYDIGDEYKVSIEKITDNAPMPNSTEITLNAKEEKTFGTIEFSEEGTYEYKVTLDGDDTYYVYTVVVTKENDVLKQQSFVKEKGEGEKLSKVTFTVVNEKPSDDTPTPSKPVNPNTKRTIINPFTADFLFKFLGVLIVSGVVVFIAVTKIKKTKETE